MNIKPAIGFLTRDGQASFAERVTVILQKLTGNPSFPSPTPALPAVQTAFDAYTVAAANAVKGGVQAMVIRNALRAELVAMLRQLASDVATTASGNLEKLLSCGCPVQKPNRTPIGPLPATPPSSPTAR